MKQPVSIAYTAIGIVFCTSLLIANLFATKLILIGPYTATAALLVFPITYIANDCLAEIWGFARARFIIVTGLVISMAFVIFSTIAVALPSPAFWPYQASFEYVFGLAPRITIASLCAFFVGSILNAYVMSRMKTQYGLSREAFSARAILSTIIGETADSVVFYPIAFWGLVPMSELVVLMLVQVTLKTVYEIVFLPVTIRIVNRLRHYENTVHTTFCSSKA